MDQMMGNPDIEFFLYSDFIVYIFNELESNLDESIEKQSVCPSSLQFLTLIFIFCIIFFFQIRFKNAICLKEKNYITVDFRLECIVARFLTF